MINAAILILKMTKIYDKRGDFDFENVTFLF